ncbi:uncharacterized protein LOC133036958 [Cannabis sativa]|uniref:uncharacterized protein LOC133036958 n=1 Tax=Cannabis sativa TaxID=3483 RepID=UPI0029C9DDC3|nr:uncharacterized protein LOC133036958 [Cannabis sativa]
MDWLEIIKFIHEAFYPVWMLNHVLVPMPNRKLRVCIDFTHFNKACRKNNFPLSGIDELVDSTVGHELLCFMDAYTGYIQIPINLADEEHTSFIIDRAPIVPFTLHHSRRHHVERSQEIDSGIFSKYGKDFEEMFAPVAKMTIVRTLIAVATVCQWTKSQMDVKNAFLNGDLHKEVYIVPPHGVPHKQ